MPLVPGPTIPYPAGSGAQECADWCASSIAALKPRVVVEVGALVAIHTWLMQRQWLTDGGHLASYPLPLASGPAIALSLYGSASDAAGVPDQPSLAFFGG